MTLKDLLLISPSDIQIGVIVGSTVEADIVFTSYTDVLDFCMRDKVWKFDILDVEDGRVLAVKLVHYGSGALGDRDTYDLYNELINGRELI